MPMLAVKIENKLGFNDSSSSFFSGRINLLISNEECPPYILNTFKCRQVIYLYSMSFFFSKVVVLGSYVIPTKTCSQTETGPRV